MDLNGVSLLTIIGLCKCTSLLLVLTQIKTLPIKKKCFLFNLFIFDEASCSKRFKINFRVFAKRWILGPLSIVASVFVNPCSPFDAITAYRSEKVLTFFCVCTKSREQLRSITETLIVVAYFISRKQSVYRCIVKVDQLGQLSAGNNLRLFFCIFKQVAAITKTHFVG